jgi:hypothetical protein
MATNLVDLIKGDLTRSHGQGGVVRWRIRGTSKALGVIVPTTVAVLSNLATTKTGAEQISQALAAGKYDGSLLRNVGSLFSKGCGRRFSPSATVSRRGGCSGMVGGRDRIFPSIKLGPRLRRALIASRWLPRNRADYPSGRYRVRPPRGQTSGRGIGPWAQATIGVHGRGAEVEYDCRDRLRA